MAIQERAGADRGGPGGKGWNTDGAAYTLEGRSKVQAVAQPYEFGNCLTRRMHKGINTTLNEGQTLVLAFANTAGNTGLSVCKDHAPPVTARKGDPGMVAGVDLAVRRLMPVECERLQGFPDCYTAIKYKGKPAADSPRYQALGNSMAVNVMRWIGERIRIAGAA